MTIISIIVILLILTAIVSIHEFGHFITAQKFGVYCKEFAIGMGKKLFSRQKGETEFSIRMIPMGGFVQMIGEDGSIEELFAGDEIWIIKNLDGKISDIYKNEPEAALNPVRVELIELSNEAEPQKLVYKIEDRVEETECLDLIHYYDEDNYENWLVAKTRQFTNIHPWKKIVVLTAGVFLNFVLAFVLTFGATMLNGVTVEPIIQSDGYAQVEGNVPLMSGDKILTIDGIEVKKAEDVTQVVSENMNKKVKLDVLRQGETISIERTILTAETQEINKDGIQTVQYGILGVQYERNHSNVLAVLKASISGFLGMFQSIFYTLASLFSGKVAVTNLTGIVGITSQTSAMLQVPTSASGLAGASEMIARVFSFTAFLSLNIGFVNILPFPALDGGRVVFALYELIFKRKASPKFEMYLNAAGFILLIGLFLLVTVFDVTRLFR